MHVSCCLAYVGAFVRPLQSTKMYVVVKSDIIRVQFSIAATRVKPLNPFTPASCIEATPRTLVLSATDSQPTIKKTTNH